MTQSSGKEFRDLVARLSDGTLSTEEALLLNQILKHDEIAQQAYLDHLFVDGLLEREFGGGAATGFAHLGIAESTCSLPRLVPTGAESRTSGWRFRFPWWDAAFISASIVLILIAGLYGAGVFTTPEVGQSLPLMLSNAGFESGPPQHGAVSAEGVWFGQSVEVVGPVSEVDPLEGARMLRFVDRDLVRDGGVVYQLVDLGMWEKVLGDGEVSVQASAHFNAAIDGDDDPRLFSIRLYAFQEKPACIPGVEPLGWGRPLVFAGRHFAADADADSWQNAAAQLELTPEARYLVIQLSVIDPSSDSDDESEDYFVDKVDVSLVTSR